MMASKPQGKLLASQRRVLETSVVQSGGSHSTFYRILQEKPNDQNESLQEQLVERERYITRLQDTLQSEREKSFRLQSRCNQQAAELKRREQHISRMREKLCQFSDRHRDRGPSIDIINMLPKPSTRKESTFRSTRTEARKEEALLLLLERREAELREAMKLRHSLTTLLHALRTNMQQTLTESDNPEEENEDTGRLIQSEQSLGDHVTGGVVLEWTHVQRTVKVLQAQSLGAVKTDQEKLLAQLQDELEQSRSLVRLQQELLQDSVDSPLPDSLTDSYYLEEWERLQNKWAEFNHQRQSFQQERQAFTDAAIRLGREKCEFEQQKGFLMKQQFLCTSPRSKISHCNRRESTALSDLRLQAPDDLSLSPCVTPSSDGSEITPWFGQRMVKTPSTAEFYHSLQLPYDLREEGTFPGDS